MFSAEYVKRMQELGSSRDWPKPALIRHCAELGHYGVTSGLHGLAGWTREELADAILRSEFPVEASRG